MIAGVIAACAGLLFAVDVSDSNPVADRVRVGAAASAVAEAAEAAGAAVPVERLEPEPIEIGLEDLPKPYASESARKSPTVVPVPEDFRLKVPAGFEVSVFAEEVPAARWLAVTPEGDVVCSCGRTNSIYLLKDSDGDGAADERSLLLSKQTGANLPFGMDFATDGEGKSWFYVGNTDAVVRFPWKAGTTEIAAKPQRITELPGQGYNQHWTRNVRVAPDGGHLFVTVGSKSNVDVEQPPRAAVLKMKLDGSGRSVFGSGLRNPVGLDFHPATGAVYVNVNERDQLGDNLVPDYFAKVVEGGYYGWPFAYLAPENLDPRRTTKSGESERPDLAAKTRTPEVLYQAHSAALGLAFCPTEGAAAEAWPAKYRGGAFSVFRGSWNRSAGTGYKVAFVPFEDGEAVGHYEDFVTGFLLDPSVPKTCGRPVGAVFLADGSLLFTEEAHGRIYRVRPVGGPAGAAE